MGRLVSACLILCVSACLQRANRRIQDPIMGREISEEEEAELATLNPEQRQQFNSLYQAASLALQGETSAADSIVLLYQGQLDEQLNLLMPHFGYWKAFGGFEEMLTYVGWSTAGIAAGGAKGAVAGGGLLMLKKLTGLFSGRYYGAGERVFGRAEAAAVTKLTPLELKNFGLDFGPPPAPHPAGAPAVPAAVKRTSVVRESLDRNPWIFGATSVQMRQAGGRAFKATIGKNAQGAFQEASSPFAPYRQTTLVVKELQQTTGPSFNRGKLSTGVYKVGETVQELAQVRGSQEWGLASIWIKDGGAYRVGAFAEAKGWWRSDRGHVLDIKGKKKKPDGTYEDVVLAQVEIDASGKAIFKGLAPNNDIFAETTLTPKTGTLETTFKAELPEGLDPRVMATLPRLMHDWYGKWLGFGSFGS